MIEARGHSRSFCDMHQITRFQYLQGVSGARTCLRDLPNAELRLFDTGHFALEEHVDEIAALIGTFIQQSIESQ